MVHHPEFKEFVQLARRSSVVPVYRRLVSDTLTPVSAFCKLNRGGSSFLFESVIGGEKVGRYSFVGAEPFLHFEAFGNEVRITQPEDRTPPIRAQSLDLLAPRPSEGRGDPLTSLESLLARYSAQHVPGLANSLKPDLHCASAVFATACPSPQRPSK